MSSRTRKFLAYYKPYLALLLADMACAGLVALIALLLPLFIRLITKTLQQGAAAQTLAQVYALGAVMLLLIAIHTACNWFVDYRGHTMGP